MSWEEIMYASALKLAQEPNSTATDGGLQETDKQPDLGIESRPASCLDATPSLEEV
jgi:hypothetical protein